ncbi:MAG: hypothetical protein ABWY55_12240 [Microbacterium sp.]
MAASRPFGVTLVAIIAWITGALQIITGVIHLFSAQMGVGVAAIVIGIITILVSIGLFGGSNGARIIVAIIFVLNIAGSIWLMLTAPAAFWSALGSLILPLIGLVLLYTSRANAFFSGR